MWIIFFEIMNSPDWVIFGERFMMDYKSKKLPDF
jgi:hypothetical protein